MHQHGRTPARPASQWPVMTERRASVHTAAAPLVCHGSLRGIITPDRPVCCHPFHTEDSRCDNSRPAALSRVRSDSFITFLKKALRQERSYETGDIRNLLFGSGSRCRAEINEVNLDCFVEAGARRRPSQNENISHRGWKQLSVRGIAT